MSQSPMDRVSQVSLTAEPERDTHTEPEIEDPFEAQLAHVVAHPTTDGITGVLSEAARRRGAPDVLLTVARMLSEVGTSPEVGHDARSDQLLAQALVALLRDIAPTGLPAIEPELHVEDPDARARRARLNSAWWLVVYQRDLARLISLAGSNSGT